MNVYEIEFDGDLFYLEAESFGAAVKRWKIWMKNNYKEDYEDGWEPDSVVIVRNGNVLRTDQINNWLAGVE